MDYEEVGREGRDLLKMCRQSQKGSVYHDAFAYWLDLNVPGGLMNLPDNYKEIISGAILNAYIAGRTAKLTGGEDD